ncbi:MAG: hypothetical protein KatS3mg009_0020 [Acidimicrobiia bacterium]|nr:MAG: hypothetical protein KatS3mg009_0020 [Acidimicrobiia bacterium]
MTGARDRAADLWWAARDDLGRRFRAAARPRRRPPHDLGIDELVSPLRYDIVIRMAFFRFVRANRELAHTDPRAFTELALGHPYAAWFEEIVVPRLGSRAATRASRVEAFHRRVRRTVRLDERFSHRGFDARHPVSVRYVEHLTTDGGKTLRGRFYPVDGCHRLALLSLQGLSVLPRAFYRIVEVDGPPPDNTRALLRRVPVSESDYAGFVGRGYGLTAADLTDLLARAQGLGDPKAAEIAQLVAIDAPLLAAHS